MTTLGTFQLLKVVTDSTKAEVSEAVNYFGESFPAQESFSGSTFCNNLARYMATAAEDKKFYDLTIKTRWYKILLSRPATGVW